MLADALRGGPGTVAYVNFPNIDNPGDSAIYRGTTTLLDRLGVEVALTLEPDAYRRRLVRGAVGERGTILIQGGGNLGDLYRKQGQHRLRLRLFRDFPQAELVQLPQTMHFSAERSLRRFQRLCLGHERLKLMLRDDTSSALAESLGIPSTRCPDLAVGLGPLERHEPPSLEVARLLRGDVEAAPDRGAAGAESYDWPSGAEQRAGTAGQRLRRDLAAAERWGRLAGRLPKRLDLATVQARARRYPRLAAERLALAMRLVSRGRVLITDRLHAHLLASQMGIPNVLLDNSYGKNRSVFESWSHRYPCARFAEGIEHADAVARGMLAEPSDRVRS